MVLSVRNATHSDIPWLVQELEHFAVDYDTEPSLFGDLEYAIEKLGELITKHVVLIAEQENKPVGFIAGLINNHMMNPSVTILTQLFWWVSKKKRKNKIGSALLDTFIDYGEQHADWISCNLSHAAKMDDKCLISRGFRLQEKSFYKRVD